MTTSRTRCSRTSSYDLTERSKLGVGVRYFEDDQTTFDGTLTETDSFDSIDPRVYASFKLTHDINIYASAAKGFRSGGFNRGELPNYEPESLWSYELGVKGQSRRRRVRLRSRRVLQRLLRHAPSRPGVRRGARRRSSQLTTNIGKVEVKGVEAGSPGVPREALTLNATAAYIDSEITEVNATDATNIAGDPVDYVPEFSYTAGRALQLRLERDAAGLRARRLQLSRRGHYVDRTSFPAENLPQFSDDISLSTPASASSGARPRSSCTARISPTRTSGSIRITTGRTRTARVRARLV